MRLSICATGDLMLLEPFPEQYDYKTISNIISQCDIKITNIESVVSNWNCFASTFCGGQWINTEPENLNDVQKYGFNLYGCANNHSMDYSFDGILSTCKELKKRKMKYAGIGESLTKASSPVYLKLPEKNIKVAFISVTSTFIDAARAGDSRDDIPARPGINPLRVNTKYIVTKEHFKNLQEIAEKTHINGERDNARKIGSLPPEVDKSINFGGHFFIESENNMEGKITSCNKADLTRITNEIKRAKENSDYVIVSIHSHQIRKTNYTEPDFFLEEFAHSCIDSGASVVFGTGTHQLKPIEIYKNRPIFYSLGNFVFETDKVKKLPLDFWDKYHYPINLTVEEGLAKKTKNGTIGLETDENNYLSIIPIIIYENNILQSISLVPIELNFNREKKYKGLPYIATSKSREKIVEQLISISQEYKTKFIYNRENLYVKI